MPVFEAKAGKMNAAEIITKYATPVVGVGVSGGMDSVTLLYLATKVLGPERVIAIHVEHGIRGEESKQDCEFVKEFCKKLKVQCQVTEIDVPALVLKNGGSEETVARDERKKIFDYFSKEHNDAKVLLAHHSDDQVETVLMHILRGCSLKGLIGMTECDGIIVRPFIHYTRSQIETLALLNKIEYRVDSTNLSSKYTRNFLRNEVLPLVKQRYGTESLLRLSENARIAYDFITSFVKEEDFIVEEDSVTFPYKNMHKALINEYVLHAFRLLGVTNNTANYMVNMVSALTEKPNGSKVSLAYPYEAIKEYDMIAIYVTKAKPTDEQEFMTGMTPLGDGLIIVSDTTDAPQKSKTIFDADKIPYGAIVRFRKDGDFFKPYGDGTKKLKEYFIDKKIARRKRDFIPLLCDGNRVLAVVGYEISDDVRIDEKTTRKQEIRYEK